MPLQDSLKHAADMAKWKIEQQRRFFKMQGDFGSLENELRTQKALLADTVLLLFNQGQLGEAELVKICNAITSLHKSVAEKQREQEAIKEEQPPDSAITTDLPKSGLKCPRDGRLLVGRFCPEHGLEGIPISHVLDPTSAGRDGSSGVATGADALVCPKDGRVLAGRFCPEHGVEGISKN